MKIYCSVKKSQQNNVSIIKCVKKEKKGIIYLGLEIYGIFLQRCNKDNNDKNGCPPGRKSVARNTGGRDLLFTLF